MPQRTPVPFESESQTNSDLNPPNPVRPGWTHMITGPKLIGILILIIGICLVWIINRDSVKSKVTGFKPLALRLDKSERYPVKSWRLTTNDWSDLITVERGMRFEGHMLTKNVIWLAMLDEDPNRIVRMLPDNWSTNRVTETYNCLRVKVDPDQTVNRIPVHLPMMTEGVFEHVVHPMDEPKRL